MIDPGKPNFGGTPVAPWRARLAYAPFDPGVVPCVSIVTPVSRATPLLFETLESLQGQSLQAWRWILVEDGPSDPDTAALLDLAQRRDARVERRTLAVQQGPARARNIGVLASRTRYVHLLEAGDLLEATALEKSFWALRARSEWAFVRAHSIEVGDVASLHAEALPPDGGLAAPPVAGGAMFRRDAFVHAGGFDGLLGDDALAWWDLWLRCADRGLVGGCIAEVLVWWRTRAETAPERIDAFRDTTSRRYERLRAHGAATRSALPAPRATDESGRTQNPLAPQVKRVLAVVPDLTLDGVSAVLFESLAVLHKRGWKITIAATRTPAQEAAIAFGRLSADIHRLDTFLRPADQPRFLRELMESRRPAWVLVAPGRFGAAVTTQLRAWATTQRFAVLRHLDPNDADLDRMGVEALAGEATTPDLQLCTDAAECDALGAGAVPLPLAVDTTVWRPRTPPRQWMRPQWGADPDDTVLLFTGRLGLSFRSDVAAATLAALLRRGVSARFVVAASGPGLSALRSALAQAGCSDRTVWVGDQTAETWIRMLSAADVFFAPVDQGTSLSVVRAMACELPVATSATGAQASLVDGSCGVTVAPRDVDTQVRGFADAIESWARDPALRSRLGRAARQRVLAHHGPDALALALLSQLTPDGNDGNRRARNKGAGDPDAEAVAARLFEVADARAAGEALREANDALAAQCAALAARVEDSDATRAWLEARVHAAEAEIASRASQIEAQQRQIERLVEALEWRDEQRRAGFDPPRPPGDHP